MARVWFTADTHFDHGAIIEYCGRPFASVEEMNETIIERWNAVVGQQDLVYHLGDLALTSAARLEDLVRRLKGRIHLIPGNHDSISAAKADSIGIRLLAPLKVLRLVPYKLLACHYPLADWHGAALIHLHGHTHGALERRLHRLDVGVDANDFTPLELEDVLRMASEAVVHEKGAKRRPETAEEEYALIKAERSVEGVEE